MCVGDGEVEGEEGKGGDGRDMLYFSAVSACFLVVSFSFCF